MEEYSLFDENLGKVTSSDNYNLDELTDFQKAILYCDFEIEDNVLYDARLVEIKKSVIKDNLPVLNFIYEINGVNISDSYFFSRESTIVNMKRLKKTLTKFNYFIDVNANKELDNLINALQCLVNSLVKIKQFTREVDERNYKNYEIVSVTRRGC